MKNTNLKKAGLKSTLPRIKILELLENIETDKHLSAEEVYKLLLNQGDDVGLATVYRVLTQFEEAGLVTRHHFDGLHSIFELNRGEHHDHLVCTECGNVDEFYDETIERTQKKVAKEHKFKMTDHSLYIYGICAKCQEELKS